MSTVTEIGIARERKSHIFNRHPRDRYVDPAWCSERLFAVERFPGLIWDPAAGTGNILKAARAAGLSSYASDIDAEAIGTTQDFLTATAPVRGAFSICCNPPFSLIDKFAEHALEIGALKVAMIWSVPRLIAAHWLEVLPLRRIWLLQPRPSMLAADALARGQKAKNGYDDFCWLIFEPDYEGEPMIGWLHRESRRTSEEVTK